MKRVVAVVAVVVVLLGVLAAVFIVPSMRLKSGLAQLASSLPDGMTLTWGDAHYGLFDRRVTLLDPVLKLASPALELHADRLDIENGNAGLQAAVAEAKRAPDLQNADMTPVADRIVVTNLHTAYQPIDVHVGRAEIDGASLALHQLLGALPPIDQAQAGGQAYPVTLQKVAQSIVASVYRHGELDDLVVQVQTDPGTGEKVTFRAAAVSSDGFDHGNIAATSMKGFDMASGTFDLTVDSIAAGDTLHREFWTALRDGAPLDTAVEKFQGASQTVETVKATSNGQPVGSLQRMVASHIGYKGGLPVSLDLDVAKLDFDPVLLPDAGIADTLRSLGYKSITLDGHAHYVWDQAAQTIVLDPVSVVMDQGGTLTLQASLANADPKLPRTQYKLAGASLRYDDAGLAGKWIGYVAAQTKHKPDEIRASYVKWLEEQKPAFKNDPPLMAAFAGLEAFVADPHSLVIAFSPPQPVGLDQFEIGKPQNFTGKLGLSVTAPGSSVKAPVAIPVH